MNNINFLGLCSLNVILQQHTNTDPIIHSESLEYSSSSIKQIIKLTFHPQKIDVNRIYIMEDTHFSTFSQELQELDIKWVIDTHSEASIRKSLSQIKQAAVIVH